MTYTVCILNNGITRKVKTFKSKQRAYNWCMMLNDQYNKSKYNYETDPYFISTRY